MKRLLLIAALVAGAPACVDATDPIELLEARRVDAQCTVLQDAEQLLRGSLNYSAGQSYIAAFQLQPTFSNSEDGDRSFIANEAIFNYRSENPEISFDEERIDIYYVIRGDGEGGYIRADLIWDKARKKLDAATDEETGEPTIGGPDNPMTLFVTLKFKGKFSTGGSAETDEAVFPISIYRGGPVCTTGTPQPAGPCSVPGQDGAEFTCG